MAHFRYKLRNATGEPVTGVTQAATRDKAGQLLRSEGQFVIKMEELNDPNLAV